MNYATGAYRNESIKGSARLGRYFIIETSA